MGLETATTISGLEPSYPLAGDDTNRGDDHLRLIKSVLQATFPGNLGGGFATAILADETELNYLQGLSSNAQDQFDALGVRVDALEDALSAPSGTAMLFYNTNVDVPTGWTIQTVVNNTMLRVVSAAAGTSFVAGDSPILMDKVPSHTHTADNNGDHVHTIKGGYNAHDNCTYSTGFSGASLTCGQRSGVASTEGDHTHTINANASAANWTPNYSDVVIAVKD